MYTMSIDISHYHENTSRACKNLSVGPRNEASAGIQTPYPHPGKRAGVKAPGRQSARPHIYRVKVQFNGN